MKEDLSNLSMLELFRVETENQTVILTSGLLELERALKVPSAKCQVSGNLTPDTAHLAPLLEAMMRAAHSLKGAARIVNLPSAVRVAHGIEDCFVAAQEGKLELREAQIDVLLRGVDLLANISKRSDRSIAAWEDEQATEIEDFLTDIARFIPAYRRRATKVPSAKCQVSGELTPDTAHLAPPGTPTPPSTDLALLADVTAQSSPARQHSPRGIGSSESVLSRDLVIPRGEASDRVLRLTAENLNRLLGLAGESLVESRWLRPFSESMQRLKRMQSDLERTLDGLRQSLEGSPRGIAPLQRGGNCDQVIPRGEDLSEQSRARINELFRQAAESRQFLADRLQDLDLFDRRSAHLSNRLYLEVLRTRMRPFGDGTRRFPRMVRDLARSLGKHARLEIIGENTQVDRDILDRLETPLAHLLRNAVDHGCEMPEERERAGKPAEATIQLEARHSAGLLVVVVSDDGAGLDPERVRRVIAEKKLTTPMLAEKMNDGELLQFLFLPGFTVKDTVTEISGRGVGLDIVQDMVKSVRGSVRVSTQPGCGMRFQLQLPLTLSVLRTLLVEVGGEPYAFPLAQIAQTLRLPCRNIEMLEGRHHFKLGEQQVGLLAAHQVFDIGDANLARGIMPTERRSSTQSGIPQAKPETDLPIVVLGDRNTRYGLVVDRFLGERELVVQPLDPRLGKVKDISAAALMEDGAPVLIVDVDDMMRSIEKLISSGTLVNVQRTALDPATRKRKRVLAVDDSLTVRELERKLLAGRGYLADVAVDGMDAWNAVRTGVYDLVITDVDMPRMDGIELATLIKQDPHLKSLPVMIVSYKDREEDRFRGLDAGADYYLTKGSFHDETLLQAVQDLIGEPDE